MGKLRQLRTRFISSIGAVKRSVLRRQSQSSSTVSNPTTLTRLASLDSAVPASTGTRGNKRKSQVRLQAQEGEEEQLQLHWNEARRIYSEPVQVTQGLSVGEGSTSCVTGTTVADCHNAASQEQLVRNNSEGGSQLSNEEDYDDVFLQSWEEAGWC